MYSAIEIKSELKVARQKESDLNLASKIAYVVSHDLKAPVNHIKSYVKLLERDLGSALLSDRVKQDLQAIEVSVGRMDLLLQALAQFANVPERVHAVPVSTSQCLKKAVQQLEALFQSHNIVLEVGDLPSVMGDFDLLTTLFKLLIQNAVIYNHSDPIWLECFVISESEGLIFCIKDNGDAVPHAHQQQIFEPSKRLHSLRDQPGAGMGLAIGKRIIEAHGGKIWVESSGISGEGSAFKFIIGDLKHSD